MVYLIPSATLAELRTAADWSAGTLEAVEVLNAEDGEFHDTVGNCVHYGGGDEYFECADANIKITWELGGAFLSGQRGRYIVEVV